MTKFHDAYVLNIKILLNFHENLTCLKNHILLISSNFTTYVAWTIFIILFLSPDIISFYYFQDMHQFDHALKTNLNYVFAMLLSVRGSGWQMKYSVKIAFMKHEYSIQHASDNFLLNSSDFSFSNF